MVECGHNADTSQGTLLGTMAKDQTFRFRLDDDDRRRLDALARHYSAPAATVVRILVAEKARELGLEAAQAPAPATTKTRPSTRAAIAPPAPARSPSKKPTKKR